MWAEQEGKADKQQFDLAKKMAADLERFKGDDYRIALIPTLHAAQKMLSEAGPAVVSTPSGEADLEKIARSYLQYSFDGYSEKKFLELTNNTGRSYTIFTQAISHRSSGKMVDAMHSLICMHPGFVSEVLLATPVLSPIDKKDAVALPTWLLNRLTQASEKLPLTVLTMGESFRAAPADFTDDVEVLAYLMLTDGSGLFRMDDFVNAKSDKLGSDMRKMNPALRVLPAQRPFCIASRTASDDKSFRFDLEFAYSLQSMEQLSPPPGDLTMVIHQRAYGKPYWGIVRVTFSMDRQVGTLQADMADLGISP